MSASASEFWKLVQQDAAVQERFAVAVKQTDPIRAVLDLAASLDLKLTAEELRESIGELGERELDLVAGGVSSPVEMFAEMYTAIRTLNKIESQ